MRDWQDLKVYSPGFQAIEWGFDYSQCVDLPTALAQSPSIAVVPVYFDRPTEFSYNPAFADLDLEQFDLVLFTEIEWRSQTELIKWIETTSARQWLLHVAGLWEPETLDARTIYRPAWTFNFLRWNPARDDFPADRPYQFECLLGARREHRDLAMLSFQKWSLLDRSLVTYRDIFLGHWITDTPARVQDLFPGQSLCYPYVSANLDPSWEVKSDMDNSVSGIVPWEIYNRTWFSVVCETLGSGQIFLSAEKMGKCLQARRLFVILGIRDFLRRYRDWGFETFGDIIDESYDSVSDDITRWSMALEQVNWLCQQDLPALLHKLRARLDHNHNRLYALEQQKRDDMRRLIMHQLK